MDEGKIEMGIIIPAGWKLYIATQNEMNSTLQTSSWKRIVSSTQEELYNVNALQELSTYDLRAKRD